MRFHHSRQTRFATKNSPHHLANITDSKTIEKLRGASCPVPLDQFPWAKPQKDLLDVRVISCPFDFALGRIALILTYRNSKGLISIARLAVFFDGNGSEFGQLALVPAAMVMP